MIRNKSHVATLFAALGAGALLAIGFGDAAHAQNAGNRGAAAAQRPSMAQRPAMPASQARIPQQASERVPQQARDRAPVFGGTRPDAARSGEDAQNGLEIAREKADDQAKAVAPPLGGSLPAEATEEGLKTAGEKAAEDAKKVAYPLGGDPASAAEDEEETAAE